MGSIVTMRVARAVLVSGAVLLTGCGGYESNFSCKGYPDTPYCKSVSDAYADRLIPGGSSIDQGNGRGEHASSVTEPSLPKTFPNRTAIKRVGPPGKLLIRRSPNLLVAPMTLFGRTALSVET